MSSPAISLEATNACTHTHLQQSDAVGRKHARGQAVEDTVEDQGQDEAEEPFLGLGVVVEAGLRVCVCLSGV